MTQPAAPASRQRRLSTGVALAFVLGSVVSVETGAALGKGLFSEVPPTTAAWLRFTFAAIVLHLMRALGLLGRRLRGSRTTATLRPDRSKWLWAAGYAISMLGMNWTFYLAIERLPLGIAVTIEFLGPLAVAVIGSRRPLDLVWVALAGLGVALLGLRPAPLDPLGVVFVLVAAVCWAGYISLGSVAQRYWDGADLVTMACSVGAVGLAVPAIAQGGAALWTPQVLGLGLVVGVFSSVLPYRLDMAAFGSVPPALFGILQSLAPAAAALAGWWLLGEVLGAGDWVALVAVVVASTGATLGARQRRRAAVAGTAAPDAGATR